MLYFSDKSAVFYVTEYDLLLSNHQKCVLSDRFYPLRRIFSLHAIRCIDAVDFLLNRMELIVKRVYVQSCEVLW